MLIQYYGDLLRHNKIKSFALIYENPLASFPLIDQLVKNAGGTLFQRDQVRSEDVLSCNLLTVHSWAANYRNLLDTIPHRRECFYADGYSGFFQYHNFSFDDPKFHSLLFFGFIFNRDNHPLERVQKSFLQIPFSVLREAFLQLPRLKGLGSLACRFQENDAFLALRYWGRNDYTFRNEASFTDVLGDYIQTFVPKGKRLVIKGDTRIAPANLEQTVAMASRRRSRCGPTPKPGRRSPLPRGRPETTARSGWSCSGGSAASRGPTCCATAPATPRTKTSPCISS